MTPYRASNNIDAFVQRPRGRPNNYDAGAQALLQGQPTPLRVLSGTGFHPVTLPRQYFTGWNPLPLKSIFQCSLELLSNYSVQDLNNSDYPQPLGLAQVHLPLLSRKSQNVPLYPGISPSYPVWIPLYPVKSRIIPDNI